MKLKGYNFAGVFALSLFIFDKDDGRSPRKVLRSSSLDANPNRRFRYGDAWFYYRGDHDLPVLPGVWRNNHWSPSG
ncbi:hypothetical protein KCP73_13435 [Salmonella enterica subsp. enterica]|nr:hypothetical protein KCP73_13435 [Salmonella enterica subsp. enterica]